MSSRLPIFHDDFSFHDRQSRIFDDMRRQMESGFGGRSGPSPFDDHFGDMRGNFYQLRPRDPMTRVRRSDDISGSRESLDENALKSLFIEDPNTKSRRFQISFDVKDYDPHEVSVKMQNDTLLVEAKHEKEQDGNKLINEFNRKVKIPKEVDPDKLSSTMSNDGVLTISAPVPPNYQSITDKNDQQSKPIFTKSQPSIDIKSYGRNSPSLSSPHGRNSPSFPPHGQNSPTISSPPVMSNTPLYKKQIYMVPTPVKTNIISHQQNGGMPVTVRNTANPIVRAKTPPLDTPTFYNSEKGCEMVLLMDIGSPYTPDDLLVKVDGHTLTVEAEHVEVTNGKKSKSSISREFELSEHVDPDTVTALLKDGRLKITGLAK